LVEMKSRFARQYGDGIFEEIEFNTTDAFQGREREIIIFSCVRAKATGGIGFLGDIRRMNVGLTRAKSSLWVLGDSRSLQQGEFWSRLIEDAQSRDRYTSGDVMALLSKPTCHDHVHTLSANLNTTLPVLPKLEIENMKTEDTNVEMVDAPSLPNSRKSSIGSNSTKSTETKSGQISSKGIPPRAGLLNYSTKSPLSGSSPSIMKQKSGNPSPVGQKSAQALNEHGKRSGDPMTMDDGSASKKVCELKPIAICNDTV